MLKGLLAAALILGLSGCAKAKEPEIDYASVWQATNHAFALCDDAIHALAGTPPTPKLVEAADKSCAVAIAGSFMLQNSPDIETVAKWVAANPDKASVEDVERWNETSRLVGALVNYIGPEGLPYLGAVAAQINAKGKDISL